jgi:hypothetical protein
MVDRRPFGPVDEGQKVVGMPRTAHTAVATGAPPGGDTSGELDHLALGEGEEVRDAADGVVGSDNATLVVTNRRVLLILEGDQEASAEMPLSAVRTARWSPAAACQPEDSDDWDHPSQDSGARWGSVRLGNRNEGMRLSLVVAHDGERIVSLIRSAIRQRTSDAHGNGARPARAPSRAHGARDPIPTPDRRSRPRELGAPSRVRQPDPAEMSTTVFPRDFDDLETRDAMTTQLDRIAADHYNAADDYDAIDTDDNLDVDEDDYLDEPVEDSDPESVAGDAAPAEAAAPAVTATAGTPAVTPDRDGGRHRPGEKGPTRHKLVRANPTKRRWQGTAMVVGLGALTVIGLAAGNKPLDGLFGCTHAGDADSVARALASASPGDHICVTTDLPAARILISRGGDFNNPVVVEGSGTTLVGGITVHADNVVVSGFQILGDPKQAILMSGNGINVQNNIGGSGPLIPTWG